ncbi:MAG: helix-turn-helix domain-containing protein, partial [Cyanobacteria bacterium REEB65]|nr:helix-turn-helix domain-containing protein [Cyanobacteria bacterium REEB65]
MESDRDPLRKIPTKHAPEVKADIGSALKAARTRKGATLEAVGQHTRIPKKFLDALENNRFEEFPALAYLRGFLKS